ncbi:flagellar hook-associated protein FlgL [Thalassovita sp.]|uniref:flagellar hook-associated protein FlgL n=1 Tax=Thalassovita sp. TaxID=1979401 RepID=UPI002AB27B1C|nr:flagellar hook-associated protein FlgL [Thalassovita sp.]
MSIGTSLLHQTATRQFTRLDLEISNLQAEIAEGKSDPRASVDPVRSLNMSATRDQKAAVEQFTENVERADARLTLADTVMGEVGNVLNRLSEIAIRGATGSVSPSERESLRIEALELRDSLVSQAQTRDSTGRALFGGYQTDIDPFVDDGSGVQYVGDTGRHALRVSENAIMATGLNGQELFMDITVEGPNGPETRDIFSIVDDLLHTLTPGGGERLDTITSPNAMRLQLGDTVGQVGMTLEGPNGTAEISAPFMASSQDAMIAAINAETATTGITAIVDPTDPTAIQLTAAGDITMSGLEVNAGNDRAKNSVVVTPLDGDRANDMFVVVPEDETVSFMVRSLNAAHSHVADARGEIGALQQVGERHRVGLDKRFEMVERALAGYEGLDIAKAVTELSAMMMNREAAQQTYAKISSRTLFDFLG